jgi:hypothetical protein
MDLIPYPVWRNAAVHEAGLSDEQLSAELRKWTGTSPALHPVGELLDRHWAAAFAYARLCTDGPRAAGMLTTAAFTRLFGESLRAGGPATAWRPHVLVTVRRIAAEWDTDGRRELLHPALRPGTGERAAARLLPPPGRRLLSRAFQRLPQTSRAVLWHVDVEAEPPAVPAGLLGLDEEEVLIELRRARERLREECLQVHRELAPEADCRRYQRMLDVTCRRAGTDMDPDLQQHLAGCTHCRRTAEQLARFDDGLGLALAEAVLGWGARAYLASRARRAETAAEPAPAPTAVAPLSGEDFASDTPSAPARTGDVHGLDRPAGSRRSTHRAARRTSRRNLAAAVVTVSGLVVLPLALWAALGSGDGNAARAARTPAKTPGGNSGTASRAGAKGTGRGAVQGRLHNLASGLCVGVAGEKAVQGAETELAACSSTPSQRWTYEADGLLRNAAAPELCLDSHLGYSVRLAPCTATGKAARYIRYDFTLQGALIPRWNQDLALAPAATDGSGALVLKTRAPGSAQRWSVDTAKPDLQMQNVNWDSDSDPSPAPTGQSPTMPGAGATGKASGTPSSAPGPTATTTGPGASPSPSYDWCTQYPSSCDGGGYGGGSHGGGYGGGGHRHR